MNCSTDAAQYEGIPDAESPVEEYERLIEDYYGLARKYAALEAEGSRDGVRREELTAEMADIKAELSDVCDILDEDDYEALFGEVDG